MRFEPNLDFYQAIKILVHKVKNLPHGGLG